MISSNVKFEHLNPVIWEKLGELTSCFFSNEPIFWILYDQGRIIRTTLDNKIVTMHQGASDAEIFMAFPEAGYIIKADKASLISYYEEINSKVTSSIGIDEFYSYMVNCLSKYPLICFAKRYERMPPPAPWVNPYAIFDKIIKEYLPPSCNIYLEVIDNNQIWFSIFVEINNYSVTYVSSENKYKKNSDGILFMKKFHRDWVIETLSNYIQIERKNSCV